MVVPHKCADLPALFPPWLQYATVVMVAALVTGGAFRLVSSSFTGHQREAGFIISAPVKSETALFHVPLRIFLALAVAFSLSLHFG